MTKSKKETQELPTQKLLLTAIIKDDSEIEMVERMLGSFLPYMHGAAITLTGTSKKWTKIKKLLGELENKTDIPIRYAETTPKTHPDIYYQKESGDYIFANFAAARNASFELAEQMQKEHQYDWWTWADTDDVLIHGEQLQDIAAKAKNHKLDSVYFTYWYSVQLDEKGDVRDVAVEHIRERLLRPSIWKWVSRLHEISVPKEDGYNPLNSEYRVDPEAGQTCVWCHLPGEERTQNNLYRNMLILEIQKEEEERQGKDDPRTTFYLGKTYQDHGFQNNEKEYLDKAVKCFKEYVQKSGWEEERANAWEYLGNIATEREQYEEATDYYLKGIAEFPQSHMLNLLLAKSYFERGLREKGKHWLDVATKLPEPSARTTIGTPLEIKTLAASLRYNDAITEQRLEDAIHWLKIRNNLIDQKDDEMMTTLQEAKELNDAATWLFNYAKWLKKQGYDEKIKSLLEAVAPEMKKERFVQQIASEVLPPQTWPKKSIVYFAGPTFEPWSPKSMKKGLGGSETAIVQLAKQWAKKGYKVTVYADVGEDEGMHEGVEYKQWQTINWRDQFYIFIVWRNPSLLDQGIKAYKLLYDAHDIENALNWTEERIKAVDKAFFKSAWHRSHVPSLPDDKCAIIHNGIDI